VPPVDQEPALVCRGRPDDRWRGPACRSRNPGSWAPITAATRRVDGRVPGAGCRRWIRVRPGRVPVPWVAQCRCSAVGLRGAAGIRVRGLRIAAAPRRADGRLPRAPGAGCRRWIRGSCRLSTGAFGGAVPVWRGGPAWRSRNSGSWAADSCCAAQRTVGCPGCRVPSPGRRQWIRVRAGREPVPWVARCRCTRCRC